MNVLGKALLVICSMLPTGGALAQANKKKEKNKTTG